MTEWGWTKASRAAALATVMAVSAAGCAAIAKTETDVAAESAVVPPAGPALWRVADEDSVVWLFGSVHILNPDVDWRRSEIDEAFAAADTVYLEVPVDAGAQQAAAALIPAVGFNPGGVTLSSMLDEGQRALLARVAGQVSLPPATLEPMRPWLAGVMIGVQAIVAEGGDPMAGVEMVLAREAEAAGKQLRYFETIEEQLGILSGLSPEAELRFFVGGLEQMDERPEIVSELMNVWIAGDVDGLSALVNEGVALEPEAFDALIVRRNRNWIPQIEAELNDVGGVTFVAVGAAHLTSDAVGVQALLEERGWTVERF